MGSIARFWLDTSLILCLLTGEPEALAQKALKVFAGAEAGRYTLRVHPLVVAEAFYTLVSFYKLPKDEVSQALGQLLDREGIEVLEEEAVRQALWEAARGGLSLVDAHLLFNARALGQGLAT
ncbi:PIN domain-containing protein [Thermus sp.]|uniref:PIN domain-containing protein n=1 Tax=Thermus sp. TaxID=275 RepID=UPI0025D1CC83|nr:PIN domain-containing protein [Thermus sp.]MCS6868277.1 PIN domain-containing protein [Thermus sp.]